MFETSARSEKGPLIVSKYRHDMIVTTLSNECAIIYIVSSARRHLRRGFALLGITKLASV